VQKLVVIIFRALQIAVSKNIISNVNNFSILSSDYQLSTDFKTSSIVNDKLISAITELSIYIYNFFHKFTYDLNKYLALSIFLHYACLKFYYNFGNRIITLSNDTDLQNYSLRYYKCSKYGMQE